MRRWRTYILISSLLGSALCRADSTPDHALTIAEYQTELDELHAEAQGLGVGAVPDALHHVPQTWRVHTEQRDFEISAEGLRRDVRRYEGDKSASNAASVRTRIEGFRREIDSFQLPPPDVSEQRSALNAILARREFSDVHGPSWMDRLKRWLLEMMFRFLRRLFGASTIPTVGTYFVYALIGAAGLALLYLVYRSILRNPELEAVVPRDLPVSAKEWTIWLTEARAAAGRGDWRDAIHLAYWAGISFLEREGFWKPDRARTPREYLRLISGQSEQRATLASLTRIFELAWYAKRDVSEQTFSEALAELEKLGCR